MNEMVQQLHRGPLKFSSAFKSCFMHQTIFGTKGFVQLATASQTAENTDKGQILVPAH